MSIFKRGRYYWYKIYVPTGKRDDKGRPCYQSIQKSIGRVGIITKQMAQEVEAEAKRKRRLGQTHHLTSKPVTLNQFIPDYIQHVKREKKSWERDVGLLKNLAEYFGDIFFSAINLEHASEYREKRLMQGIRPATLNRELACLKHVINVAKRLNRFVGDNPLGGLRMLPEENDQTRVLSYEEEDKLLACSPPYLWRIIKCALATGMRKSEIMFLMWSKVNFDTNVIIIESISTKGRRERKIPINSELREILGTLRDVSVNKDFVFLNSENRPYKTRQGISQAFREACKKAGINDITFHTCRHSFATRALEAGIPLVTVMKILGHKDTKTIMRYAHPDDTLRQAVEAVVRKWNVV